MSPLLSSREINKDFLIGIIEGLPLGVWVSDPQGNMVFINETGRSLLGNDLPHAVRELPLLGTDNQGATYRGEINIPRDNESVPIEMWTHAIRDDAGSLVYIASIFKDVRDRKQSEEALQKSELRFRNLAENVPGAIFRYLLRADFTDSVLYMSPGCYALWEVDANAVQQDSSLLWQMVDPDDLTAMQGSVVESGRSLTPWRFVWRITTPSGKRKWLEAAGKPTREANGDVIWDSLIMDVTQRHDAESILRQNEARYRLLAENINDMVCLHEPDGRYTFVSPSCNQLLGFEPEEMMGGDPYDLFHPDDGEEIRTRAHQAALLDGKRNISVTYRMRHKAGHYVWLETLTKPILDINGDVIQLQTTSRDVSERIKTQLQLRHDALHDGLTNLANRTNLLQRLEFAMKRRRRHAEQIHAVLFLDFDRFKVINDSLGHSVGDALLVAIADRLSSLVRDTDLVSRMGGDEFVVLLEDVESFSEVTHVAERITNAMQSAFNLADRELFCSVSVGIVVLTDQYQNAMDLLRDADIAMYRAKRMGGGRYALFDPTMHSQVVRQMKLESDLRSALGKRQFFLLYQPIVSLSTGELTSLEALIRWRHPADGVISPCQFIPVAEECRLIYPIGLWVIRQVCDDYASWRNKLPANSDLRVCINLSLGQVLEPAFLSDVLSLMSDYSYLGEFLTFEITESMLIHDFPAMANLLVQLRAHGIRISIDDFGTGYSSLSYLHQLPVDTLKVDRSFVQGDLEASGKFKIVQTIVTLSNSLGLDAVAEGIEDDTQLGILQQLGCEKGQGYLFARPLDGKALEELISQTHPYAEKVCKVKARSPA